MKLSHHARLRVAQRAIPVKLIDNILSIALVIHKHGALHYFLSKKSLAKYEKYNRKSPLLRSLRKLVGTTLVVASNSDLIITAYRNSK